MKVLTNQEEIVVNDLLKLAKSSVVLHAALSAATAKASGYPTIKEVRDEIDRLREEAREARKAASVGSATAAP